MSLALDLGSHGQDFVRGLGLLGGGSGRQDPDFRDEDLELRPVENGVITGVDAPEQGQILARRPFAQGCNGAIHARGLDRTRECPYLDADPHECTLLLDTAFGGHSCW
ncbi:hypothetical protein [Streptomyces hygroscopicus]|uniref:hypothetical protein n=1 Tax=Streptomyces hygroscopicus TaxID=1912 RepID=UPI00223FCB64|nr:hypothetical protein [Streptomyces hygroscopicus]